MSTFLNSVVSLGKAAMRRVQSPSDPNLVKFVSDKELAPIATVDRDDCLVLYGPRMAKEPLFFDDDNSDNREYYELVVHAQRGSSYSVHRVRTREDGLIAFGRLSNKLSLLMSLDSSLVSPTQLQLLCDCLRQRPSYSVAHVAVKFDLRQVLKSPLVLRHVNAVDEENTTPLMIAITTNNLPVINLLLDNGADDSGRLVDVNGNSIIHMAALTSKEIVQVVCERVNLGSLVNTLNKEGDTPLHIACKNDKPECVKALLFAGADVNVAGTVDQEGPLYMAVEFSSARCVKEILNMYPKQLNYHDMKHGGTPLHWAKSREMSVALLECGCQIDARNFNGKTALHVMVINESLECVVALIAHGADVDLVDDQGNTSLHLAIENGNVAIVRALVVFEANTNISNKRGQTAWRLAVDRWVSASSSVVASLVSRGEREALVLFSLLAVGKSEDSDLPKDKNGRELDVEKLRLATLNSKQRRLRSHYDQLLAKQTMRRHVSKGARLLSLDGGGIKGLVLTRLLINIEKSLGKPICECVDWIAGTSTGAILALALLQGKSALECQRLYMRLKDKVFVGSRPYDSQPLEQLLKQTFTEDAKLFDITAPKVMLTSTLADRSPPELHLFRNYVCPQSMMGVSDFAHPEVSASSHVRPQDELMWRAAKASGAAPSFFRPVANKYVDGGILANNPSVEMLTEITELNHAIRSSNNNEQAIITPSILLSLGTGNPPVRKVRVVDIFRPESVQDTLTLILNYDGMGKLMLDSILDADGKVVDQARAWCMSIGSAFCRLSAPLVQDVELDERDDRVLIDLLWLTMAYAHDKSDEIEAIKPMLLTQ